MSQFEQAVLGEFEVPYSAAHEKTAASPSWVGARVTRGLVDRGAKVPYAYASGRTAEDMLRFGKMQEASGRKTFAKGITQANIRIEGKKFPKKAPAEKTAGPFLEGLKETAKKTIPTVGAAIAAGILTDSAIRGYEGLVGAVQKGGAFKKLLAAAPDLKDIPAEKLREQFSVIYKFSPDVAKSPQVAASWIRQINTATLEGRDYIPPDAIRDLVSIQKDVTGMRGSGLSRELSKSVAQGFLKSKKTDKA
jgi:hypothetical protein